jgi:hypothetical protein
VHISRDLSDWRIVLLLCGHVSGKAWDVVLEGNEASFEGVYDANADVSPAELPQLSHSMFSLSFQTLFCSQVCVATLQNVIKDAHKALWLKLLQSKKQRVSK